MPGPPTDLITRVDALVGDGIERAVRAKHRVRLRRLGHEASLDPPQDGSVWAAGEPAPRPGCTLDVLIDGSAAFAAIAEAIEQARDFVHVCGWHIEPSFELRRENPPVVLGELLAEKAEHLDVRVLVWAGAPIPAFHPTRREVSAAVETLVRGTKIRCEPDPREHPFHCHHEKLVIVDGEVAFVGGIDMTDLAGDRFDHPAHPARRRLGWHDVGTRLRGPAVRDVHDHFALRWRELTGEKLERPGAPPATGNTRVQVARTISEVMYDAVPKGEFRILESYVRAIRSAERFIYLENQFLWAPEIVDELAHKLRDPPCEGFRIVVVLPARANNGHDDTRGQLGVLLEADGGHDRLLAATVRSLTGARDDPLYVHAKVGIVDDRWLTIGSANLNAHSLINDTEMNVVTDDPNLARETRLRLWAEHLELDPEEIADEDPGRTVDERWRPVALGELERRRRGEPPLIPERSRGGQPGHGGRDHARQPR